LFLCQVNETYYLTSRTEYRQTKRTTKLTKTQSGFKFHTSFSLGNRMNNNSARCFWLSNHLLGCLNKRCLDLANSCFSVSPLGNNSGSYRFPRFRDSSIFLLSASNTSQRYLIRSSCTAS